jgi:hypothetical protein
MYPDFPEGFKQNAYASIRSARTAYGIGALVGIALYVLDPLGTAPQQTPPAPMYTIVSIETIPPRTGLVARTAPEDAEKTRRATRLEAPHEQSLFYAPTRTDTSARRSRDDDPRPGPQDR